MSIEFLHPKVERLAEKPFIAADILRVVESWGFKPIAVSVDNSRGVVMIHFEKPLNERERKKLNEKMDELLRNW